MLFAVPSSTVRPSKAATSPESPAASSASTASARMGRSMMSPNSSSTWGFVARVQQHQQIKGFGEGEGRHRRLGSKQGQHGTCSIQLQLRMRGQPPVFCCCWCVPLYLRHISVCMAEGPDPVVVFYQRCALPTQPAAQHTAQHKSCSAAKTRCFQFTLCSACNGQNRTTAGALVRQCVCLLTRLCGLYKASAWQCACSRTPNPARGSSSNSRQCKPNRQALSNAAHCVCLLLRAACAAALRIM